MAEVLNFQGAKPILGMGSLSKNNINNTELSNTELSNTESNLILSRKDAIRYDADAYAELIRENIELDILKERYPYDGELLDAKPGDLIFFQGTYNTSGASHVGIYVGNGMMIHCGNPIQYASVNTNYWRQHFLAYGRIQ